ncbi:PREDICTED: uncharacterized protein KIAA0355-like [Paramuricea clavata]|uniref:PREDICTED: uncharacterized protein KIAA0355-like n=2 Tax=Paramuricea clavata TaxID=317549 RepID=A0A7D9IC96_PARCT|nr:PREDICTED: uncharacterized protein KIAA0355-like [Paramuricea clavata]
MADSKCSLPEAWKNGELTADTIGRRHERLLPDVADLEKDLTAVGKSIEGYIDALNNYCSAGCRVSATFAKLLGDTTLSKISQQFQQVTDKLEHKVLNDCNADISSSVLTTLSEFTSLLPAVKQEIGDYKRCKNRHSKCQETLESFAQKDVAASEGKRFQQVKERFSWADRDYTQKQEQLSQCLSSLEGNRIKMVGASLLSLLHTIAQFNGDMSTMLAPLGEYQSVGDYLRDREIAPQLKEATTTWCSFAQSYQSIRENDLSGEDVYNLLKHKKGEKLSMSQKSVLATHVKTLLEDYKKDVDSMDDGPVTIPGGFFKNPAGIRVALKGCCSRLESLAIDGVNLCPSHHDMIATLQLEIPKVQLAVASVGKPWHTVANLEGSDIVQSRQHCLKDLIEPLAKQFDIPFTKESYRSFTLTVLNEACSEKTILASKIAVQLLYGKDDLVVVKLSPDSSKTRNVRLHCKENGVNIEVQLTW